MLQNVKCFDNFLELFTSFGFFLANFCHLLALFRNFSQLLATFGKFSIFWHPIGIFHNLSKSWHCLGSESFGNFLATFSNFCQVLAILSNFFTMFWQPLTTFGKFCHFWQLFATLSISGQTLVPFWPILAILANFWLLL